MNLTETLKFVNDSTLQHNNEIWKQHPIYTDYYGSNLGRVKSHKPNHKHYDLIKKQKIDNRERLSIFVSKHGIKKQYSVKRFIYECFYGIIPENKQVFNVDTINFNNKPDNLKLADSSREIIINFNDKNKILKKRRNENTTPQYDLDGEIWKQHPTYTDYYISNLGRILNKKNNYFSIGHLDTNGYLKYQINKKTKLMHRLVLETFKPIDNSNELEVDHINTIKTDNSLSNLRWTTTKENMNNKNTILHCNPHKIKQFKLNGEFVKEYESNNDAKRAGFENAIRVANGQRKICNGFYFAWSDTPIEKINKDIKTINDSNTFAKIAQYTLDGNLIKVHESLGSLKNKFKYICNISMACNGKYKRNNAYGYKWKWIKPIDELYYSTTNSLQDIP